MNALARNKLLFAIVGLSFSLAFPGGCDDGGTTDPDGGDGLVDTTIDTAPMDVDPCSSVANPCSEEGTRCDGTSVVTCVRDANDCLVESVRDCAAEGLGECDASAEPIRCTGEDPCAGVSMPCATPERRCDGDVLIVCAADELGCLTESSEDCATSGEQCDPNAVPVAACTSASLCDDVSNPCQEPGRSCLDASTLEICDYDTSGCLTASTLQCEAPATCVSDPSTGGASCDAPCEDAAECTDAADGDAACNTDGDIETCTDVDDDGCLDVVLTECGDATCDDSGSTPVCSAASFTFGTHVPYEGMPSNFEGLGDGAVLPVYRGFQGFHMFVFGARTRGMLSGEITLDIDVIVGDDDPSNVTLRRIRLVEEDDGFLYAWDVFFALAEAPAEGTPVQLDMVATDDLGVSVTRSFEVVSGPVASDPP